MMSESIRERILRKELEFPETFANKIEKDYGILFYDEENPQSHDSNHAVIYPNKVKNLDQVLGRIAKFYLDKNLHPRIYQPYTDGYFMDNAPTFRKNSWDLQLYGQMKFMVLKGENKIKNERRLLIKEVNTWDERIANDILIPNGSLFEMGVLKKRLERKEIFVFAGYMNDRAVCLATVDYTDKDIARMDSAETAEELRGRGFARELIFYIVEFHRKRYTMPLYLWPLNKTAENIFIEAGFVTEFTAEAGSAIYNRRNDTN